MVFDFGKVSDVLDKEKKSVPLDAARLLLVDDEEQNVSSLKRALEDTYIVFATTDSEEALEIFKREHIDIILTDQRMPNLMGTELIQEIRKQFLQRYPHYQ